jgi:prepilin-type N-terminal cleavage/methylation domain-containing protein
MKKGFTLIELLAVIVILAIIVLVSTPLILNVIEESKAKTFNIEATSIEQAAEFYLASGFKIDSIPKYKEYYIPVTELRNNLKNIKEEMKNEYVIVKKTDNGIKYYYTGRDKNPYLKNRTLKEAVESDSSHIRKNAKVNGVTVNKVIGTKSQKSSIKNWVWYSGQLWQVLETTNDYVKLITGSSVSAITYGLTS